MDVTSPESVEKLLLKGSEALGLDLGIEAFASLRWYVDELYRWSRKINLVAKKQSLEQIVETHFLDSLTILPWLKEHQLSLLDIGTGAGFPGLVCKAAYPRLSLGLVEPRQKRVSFLRHVVRNLALSEVEIIAGRFDETCQSKRYTAITSRAVAEIGPFLELIAPGIGSGCQVICMKGPSYRQEMENAQHVIDELGLKVLHVKEFELPFSGARRSLVILAATW